MHKIAALIFKLDHKVNESANWSQDCKRLLEADGDEAAPEPANRSSVTRDYIVGSLRNVAGLHLLLTKSRCDDRKYPKIILSAQSLFVMPPRQQQMANVEESSCHQNDQPPSRWLHNGELGFLDFFSRFEKSSKFRGILSH